MKATKLVLHSQIHSLNQINFLTLLLMSEFVIHILHRSKLVDSFIGHPHIVLYIYYNLLVLSFLI
jgi:hypothetical protein